MMDADYLERRALTASAIVREAGVAALEHFRNRDRLSVERKGLQDLVSEADRGVEAIIRERLALFFPGEAILGEEGGGVDAERLWIIDPIDGTSNFLRGIPYWSVVLAFTEAGQPTIGVTYDPVHDEMFVAVKGRGTRRDGRPVAVSDAATPDAACVGFSFTFKHPWRDYADIVRKALESGFDHRRLGSSALMLCHVADGRLDACVTPFAFSWDVVAGLLLVEEAGGHVTPFAPPDGLAAPGGVFACAPALAPLIAEMTGITGGAP